MTGGTYDSAPDPPPPGRLPKCRRPSGRPQSRTRTWAQQRRGEPLTLCDDTDPGHREIGHDDPQRQLIVAYTRLFLLPERPNGSKLTTAASVGPYDIRLLE